MTIKMMTMVIIMKITIFITMIVMAEMILRGLEAPVGPVVGKGEGDSLTTLRTFAREFPLSFDLHEMEEFKKWQGLICCGLNFSRGKGEYAGSSCLFSSPQSLRDLL